MTREEIKILYYMTPIENLGSILERGILCHRDCVAHRRRDISNPDVQRRRARKIVPGGLGLHEYTNVYINGRNAMLFAVLHECRDMVLLGISPSILKLPGVVVTDGNAAKEGGLTRFFSPEEGILSLDRDEVMRRFWNSEDPLEQERLKWRMQAEVLVPNRIETVYIKGAFVPTLSHQRTLAEQFPSLRTRVDRDLFFGDKFFGESS